MDSCEQLLSENPNTKIIITGDINRLNIRDLLNQLSFAQLVKSSTRGNNILDVLSQMLLITGGKLKLRKAWLELIIT